jgi:hypothetical protein
VIRDLLKKTKELQRKKSKTDAQKAQNERKTSRLQSEVTIIKQLKKDEMSKFALTNTKKQVPEINPEKDADRVDKLLKQRALVRLANTSVLKKDVEAFRTKYPTWENDLVKILKVLGKKQQKKDELAKKKKRSEVKSKKKAEKLPKSDPKNEDKSEPKNEEPKGNEELDDIGNESDSGTDNETDGESSGDDLTADEFNSMEAVVKKLSKPSEKKVTHVKNDMVEDKEDKVEVENRKDGEMEIKQLDLNELIENDTSSEEEESDDENQVEVEKPSPKKLTENGQKSQVKHKPKETFL